MPAMILVTSATPDDDAIGVAQGLVNASKNAGHCTGFLALGGAFDAHAPAASLALPDESSCAGFDELLHTWRATYDVIIVEIPQLLTHNLGAHVARTADGVIVAVRTNRSVQLADRELSALLKQLGAALLGVVATPPVVIGIVGDALTRSLRARRSFPVPAAS